MYMYAPHYINTKNSAMVVAFVEVVAAGCQSHALGTRILSGGSFLPPLLRQEDQAN